MQNPTNGVNIPLSTLGGLATEFSPADLPEGGSPDNQDVAYYPGGAETRPGLSRVVTLPDASPVVYQDTFTKLDGTVFNVYMGANGNIWSENFTTNPTVLSQVGAVPANSKCKAVSAYGRLFMAFNDGFRGTDLTRQFDGTNFDRVSQEGPGANPCQILDYQGTVDLVSVAPVAHASSITSIVALNGMAVVTTSTPHGLNVGDVAVISGVSISAYNGTITVYSAPSPTSFSYEITSSPASASSGTVYPLMMVAVTQEPHGLVVGNSFSITGCSNAAFNSGTTTTPGMWVVAKVLSATSVEFIGSVSTATVGGTAVSYVSGKSQPWNPVANPSYDYGLHDGTAPTAVSMTLIAGQQISVTATGSVKPSDSRPYVTPDGQSGVVTGTAPDPSNGKLYPSAYMNQTWTAADGTSRTNLQLAALCGCFVDGSGLFVQAVPIGSSALLTVPTGAVALQLGINDDHLSDNSGSFTATVTAQGGASGGTGGTMVVGGSVSGGQHQLAVIFETRYGYMTKPSDPINFSSAGGKKLQISNIPTGPQNVIKRILAFTASGGSQWRYLDVAPRVGGNVVGTSTVIEDNVTTSGIFDFSDESLLAGTEIDVDGNNLFNLQVLGCCSGVTFYGDRVGYWGDENRVTNLKNMGFEGGIDPVSGVPYGWTKISGSGFSFGTSGDFGYALTVPSGQTVTFAQSCCRDVYGAEIISSNTQYTFKLWLKGAHAATITAAIYDPDTPTTLATATITGTSFTGKFYSAKFSAKTPNAIPVNAQLRLTVANSGATSVYADEMAMIYSDMPYHDTVFRWSYVTNPESVDGVTGGLGAEDDPAPIMDCGKLRDEFAFVTRDSMVDRGRLHITNKLDSEPSSWDVRQVADKVGACSMFGMVSGQGWIAWPATDGVRMYDGSTPVKVTQDIQSVWEANDPASLLSIFAVADSPNRRIYWGVTQSSTAKVLMLDHRFAETANEIEDRAAVRISPYTGKTLVLELSRKFSPWTIPAISGGTITTASGPTPVFGDALGRVYSLRRGQTHDDDYGQIPSYYVTSPFISEEMEQALKLGNHRHLYTFMSVFVSGVGKLVITPLADALSNACQQRGPYTMTLDPNKEMEIPLNVSAMRAFFKFSAVPVSGNDAYFNVSRMCVTMQPHPMSPIRGVTR